MNAKVVALSALLLASVGCNREPAESSPDADRPTNVLLVTLDTTRADHLTLYGYALPTSPRLAEIAEGGLVFDRAIAQASVTPVSHASLFTGQLPFRHGLRFLHGNYGYELPKQALTLAEMLAQEGFTTAAFVSAFPAGSRFGLEQGFDIFDENFNTADGQQIVTETGVVNTGKNQRTAEATNRAVFDWLATDPPGPLFVWVHYFDPHDTHLLSEEPGDAERFPPADDKPSSWFLAKYDVEIASMDRHLGELVDRLATPDRPLLLAVVGDHGQGLGDHDWWSHGLLYEEHIRVPLVLRGPGVPAGRRFPGVVRTIDVVPTLLGLLGLDEVARGAPLQGVDLRPLWAGESESSSLVGYGESTSLLAYHSPFPRDVQDVKNDHLFAITNEQWKYIHHRFGLAPDELYDLEADPGETTNLVDQQPDVVRELKAHLLSMGVYPKKSETLGGMSAADVERLRSLGYIDGK